MPHVQQHGHDLLNLSYVFTASNLFMDTLQSVVKALNRAGFSDKDYRDLTPQQDLQDQSPPVTDDLFGMFQGQPDQPSNRSLDKSGANELTDLNQINKNWAAITTAGTNDSNGESSNNAFVDQVTQQAIAQNKDYEAKAYKAVNVDIPAALEDKINKHKIKDLFKDQALALKLPQFFIHVETGSWFEDDDAVQLFERELLLKDFKLSQADSTISFEDVEAEMYQVDLEQIGDENYKATPFKVNVNDRKKFNALILKGDRESRIMNLTARLADLIGNMYPITDQEIKRYIGRIVESFSDSQIRDCLERDVSYVRKIKQKIATLADVHAHKVFIDLLDVDKILIQPAFGLSEIITPSGNAPELPKSLYGIEASMGNFESRVINDIANLENIQWWHRNLSRGKGFRINGFLNHYPDFIVRTKTGKIVALETKGDDRDNSDSEFKLKLKLGKLWEAKAGSEFKYMMIFDNNPISGAERLVDAIKKLGQM